MQQMVRFSFSRHGEGWSWMQNHFLLENLRPALYLQERRKTTSKGAWVLVLASHHLFSSCGGSDSSFLGTSFLICPVRKLEKMISWDSALQVLRVGGKRKHCAMCRKRTRDLSSEEAPGGLGEMRKRTGVAVPGTRASCSRNLSMLLGPRGQSLQKPNFTARRTRKHWVYDGNFRYYGHLELFQEERSSFQSEQRAFAIIFSPGLRAASHLPQKLWAQSQGQKDLHQMELCLAWGPTQSWKPSTLLCPWQEQYAQIWDLLRPKAKETQWNLCFFPVQEIISGLADTHDCI